MTDEELWFAVPAEAGAHTVMECMLHDANCECP